MANLTINDLDPKAQEQFELELSWCIQHLENTLISMNEPDKRNQLQMRKHNDIVKNMSTLKNKTVPIIKKRAVMRKVCGDYRTKMAEEEKEFYKSIKSDNIIHKNAEDVKQKSIFFKKAKDLRNKSESSKIISKETLDQNKEEFKFNFKNGT